MSEMLGNTASEVASSWDAEMEYGILHRCLWPRTEIIFKSTVCICGHKNNMATEKEKRTKIM